MNTLSPFSVHRPELRLAWDNTSFSAFLKCPKFYHYTMVEGWQPKRGALALDFGILMHSGMETYDKAKAKGFPHEEAQLLALKYVFQKSWNTTLRANDEGGLGDRYDSKRTRYQICRVIVWYLEQYGDNDPVETTILHTGEAAVELSFRIGLQAESSTGEEYLYCGHLDKLASYSGELWVVDHKHTAGQMGDNYFAKYTLDNQMTGYVFGARVMASAPVHGVMVNCAKLNVHSVEFARSTFDRKEDQLTEWLADVNHWLQIQEMFATTGVWPMNRSSCDMYGGCMFREVCNKSPKVRQTFLNHDFEQRPLWNPLESRES